MGSNGLANSFRGRLQSLIMRKFEFWERLGFHITPNDFSNPIPDTRSLTDELFGKTSEMVGVRINEHQQLELLSGFVSEYRKEYETFPREQTTVPHSYFINNGAFESVDGEILYCMIRHLKPRRISEIGAGNSTYLAAQAVIKNLEEGFPPSELVAFEPYPTPVLKSGFPGLARLFETKAQDIPLSHFLTLEADDILFIDSTHMLKIASDVQFLYLEVLPRLRPGVMIHVHDIFLPAEYPRKWLLEDHKFWNEQYLLQAFLAFNDSFEVVWAASYMHLKHSRTLATAFSSYNPETTWPGSFWMKKVS